jgi:sugar fermentation stimulation protein A
MVYVIQRMDVTAFGPAWDIDPAYAAGLARAVEKGVEVIPLQTRVNPEGIQLVNELPFSFRPDLSS